MKSSLSLHTNFLGVGLTLHLPVLTTILKPYHQTVQNVPWHINDSSTSSTRALLYKIVSLVRVFIICLTGRVFHALNLEIYFGILLFFPLGVLSFQGEPHMHPFSILGKCGGVLAKIYCIHEERQVWCLVIRQILNNQKKILLKL